MSMEASFLTVRAFVLTVEILCLQSVEALLSRTFPAVTLQPVSRETQLEARKAQTVS